MTDSAIRAAEEMRESAAKIVDNAGANHESLWDPWETAFLNARAAVAAAIRALPLPPDPRDATITRLSAELEIMTRELALAKSARGANSRVRRRLRRIEKFDGDKAFVAVNIKYNAAKAALATAREALMPFAKADERLPSPEQWNAVCEETGVVISFPAEDKDDIGDWRTDLTIGDLRRARAALAAIDKLERPA